MSTSSLTTTSDAPLCSCGAPKTVNELADAMGFDGRWVCHRCEEVKHLRTLLTAVLQSPTNHSGIRTVDGKAQPYTAKRLSSTLIRSIEEVI